MSEQKGLEKSFKTTGDNNSLPFAKEKINWNDINLKDGFYIVANVAGTAAATSTNYTHFFTARRPLEILRVTEVHSTAGTDAGSVTLDVQILTGTTAPGSGTSVLASTFNLKSTANTVVTKEKSDLSDSRIVKEGERICLATSGTLTAVASVQVTLYCRTANRGSYY